MNTVTTLLTLEQFRFHFDGDAKPHYEFWDGHAIQKAVPTKLHAKLQKLLAALLADLGYYSFTELSLRSEPAWEPIPDVAGTLEDIPGTYPTAPVDIVIEILSPQDAFGTVESKCGRYASMQVKDILVFDPVNRKAWRWDFRLSSLVQVTDEIARLNSSEAAIDLAVVWSRLDLGR